MGNSIASLAAADPSSRPSLCRPKTSARSKLKIHSTGDKFNYFRRATCHRGKPLSARSDQIWTPPACQKLFQFLRGKEKANLSSWGTIIAISPHRRSTLLRTSSNLDNLTYCASAVLRLSPLGWSKGVWAGGSVEESRRLKNN